MPAEKKTLEDPVSKEVLARFAEIANSRARLCNQYMDLDLEKIKIQLAVRELDKESSRLFERELLDRDIPPTTAAVIDPETGLVSLAEEEP